MKIVPAPLKYRNSIGSILDYFIHQPYEVRLDNKAFDDRPYKDEYQLQVYQYARQVYDLHGLYSVVDVGCGSGFKLVTNFYDVETTGIELEEYIPFLKTKWPDREWVTPGEPHRAPDLVISSDVIEHIVEPNQFLNDIRAMCPKRIVISTPERDQLSIGTHDGPPKNQHHVREWNFAEFHAYISNHFRIREHFVMNGTQIVECTL